MIAQLPTTAVRTNGNHSQKRPMASIIETKQADNTVRKLTAEDLAALVAAMNSPENAIVAMNFAFSQHFDVNFRTNGDTGEEYVSLEFEIRGEAVEIMGEELDRQCDAEERRQEAIARQARREARKHPELRKRMNEQRAKIGAKPI